MSEWICWTDGSTYRTNPSNAGGWAFRLVRRPSPGVQDLIWERSGSVKGINITNNQMEMTAALEAMRFFSTLSYPGSLEIRSDSSYLVNAFRQNWFISWRRNGWRNSAGKPVVNRDIWESLYDLHQLLKPTWIHVKGHAGVEENEAVDRLAKAAAQLCYP
jgi:ribonuclease HI